MEILKFNRGIPINSLIGLMIVVTSYQTFMNLAAFIGLIGYGITNDLAALTYRKALIGAVVLAGLTASWRAVLLFSRTERYRFMTFIFVAWTMSTVLIAKSPFTGKESALFLREGRR